MHRRRALRLGLFAAATHMRSEPQQLVRDIRLSELVSSFVIMSEAGSCFMYLPYA